MERHTIRLTAITGLGWICFMASFVDQKSAAKTFSPTGTFTLVNSTVTYRYPEAATRVVTVVRDNAAREGAMKWFNLRPERERGWRIQPKVSTWEPTIQSDAP
jgi:hypothetical protein